jgi:sugar lactone lactonase YvrE
MIPLESLGFHGTGLQRPECVLCTGDGRLHVADWRGGVTVIEPDGGQQTILADGMELRPNGIAIMPDGSWLLADLGRGGVFRLHPDGRAEPHLLEVDGRRIPPTNFVHLDAEGRVWATISTRRDPRSLGYRPDCDDGFIVLLEGGRARLVADGLGFTNECVARGGFLYVNETFGRRTSRFPIRADGLGDREVIASYGHGTYPDGLTFDEEGGIWITSVVSNRVIRVHADGRQEIVLEDSDPGHVAWVEEAYLAHRMDRPHLDRIESRVLRNISSLAFGGEDLRTAYLGCLLGDRIASFRSEVRGAPTPHWRVAP